MKYKDNIENLPITKGRWDNIMEQFYQLVDSHGRLPDTCFEITEDINTWWEDKNMDFYK